MNPIGSQPVRTTPAPDSDTASHEWERGSWWPSSSHSHRRQNPLRVFLGRLGFPDNEEDARGELAEAIPFPSPCFDMDVMFGAAASQFITMRGKHQNKGQQGKKGASDLQVWDHAALLLTKLLSTY